MLLTAPLLAKGSSFFGSLINKCRQVIKISPTKSANPTNNNAINFTPPPAVVPNPNADTIVDLPNIITTANRPTFAATASISSRNAAVSSKTFEEQVGLPPRPKKPLTPYFRFMKEMRPKVMADNPKFAIVDVVRLLSKHWETAEPSLKLRLQQEYKRDQQQYVEQRAKYDAKISDEQRAEIQQLKQDKVEAKERKLMRKRVKELGRPKKPASAFLLYISKERHATPQTSQQTYREWHTKCTERWTRMSDAEKAPYMQEARKELDKYKKEISIWEEKMIRLGNIDVVRHGNLIDPPEPKSKKH